MMDYTRLGTIISIDNTYPTLRAQVDVPTSGEVEEVILLNTWGSNSYPSIGSPCVIFILDCDFAQKYAIPFNLADAIAIQSGEKIIYTSTGTKIHLKQDGSIDIKAENDSTNPSINITASTAVNLTAPNVNISNDCVITNDCDVGKVYKVDGTQVVSNQGAAVPDATGGVVVDAEARTAINTLLIRLRVHGLIA